MGKNEDYWEAIKRLADLPGVAVAPFPSTSVSSVPSAILRLQSVTKRFGTVTAVDRIDLAIERGEFPREHRIKWVKSGAAPLAPELVDVLDRLK